jgi:hypothetical protein
MEARRRLKGTEVPAGLKVVLAICVTIAVAAMGAAVSQNRGSSAPVVKIGQPAPGTVLRQDNPVQSAALIDLGAERGATSGSSSIGSHHRSGGVQILDDASVAYDSGNGYQSDLTRAQPAERPGYREPRSSGMQFLS